MEYKDLPQYQKHLLITCSFWDDVTELEPGRWAEVVRLAEDDADFRSACLLLELPSLQAGLLPLVQSVCRSVNARIACEDALA